MIPYRYFILVACDLMYRNKHCAAASEFLLLQPLEDFLPSLLFCRLLKNFLTRCGWIFLIRNFLRTCLSVNSHFMFWCFVFQLLSFCRAGSSCTFWFPVCLACGSSPSEDDLKFFIYWTFPSFWQVDTTALHLWSPQHRKDMDVLERGQRRPQR